VGAYGVIGLNDNLFFMQNRFYDANVGRFIQRDPIGFAGGGTNVYRYVSNNPVDTVDPNGKAAMIAIAGPAVIAIGSGWLLWEWIINYGSIVEVDSDFVDDVNGQGGKKIAGVKNTTIYVGKKFKGLTKTLQEAKLAHEWMHIYQNYNPWIWGNHLDAELEALSAEADYIIRQIKGNRKCDWAKEKARLEEIFRDMKPVIMPSGAIKWPFLKDDYKNWWWAN
jgi:hypothetical protein